MKKILVFDNYDSFTYNLVHYVEQLDGVEVTVCRNDKMEPEAAEAFDKIILSPGPGLPAEAGLLLPLIRRYAASKPMLGVCLGHQAIGEVFGAQLLNLEQVYHGVATPLHVVQPGYLYAGLPETFAAGRYHSWVVQEAGFPDTLEITARDENGYIMGLRHRTLDVQGVQFHPESVLTEHGMQLLRNFVLHAG